MSEDVKTTCLKISPVHGLKVEGYTLSGSSSQSVRGGGGWGGGGGGGGFININILTHPLPLPLFQHAVSIHF